MTASTIADILLVEDNPGDVRLVRETLKDLLCPPRVHEAGSVDEALAFLLQRGRFADAPRPGVVLLDLDLPCRNGLELVREMHDHPAVASIPVIVLTSSSATIDRERARRSGVRSYVTKPHSIDGYLALLQSIAGWRGNEFASPGLLR